MMKSVWDIQVSKDQKCPQCTTCGINLTVKHILIECHQYINDLKKFNIPPNIDAALGPNTENITNMTIFLRKTYIFNQIFNHYFVLKPFIVKQPSKSITIHTF